MEDTPYHWNLRPVASTESTTGISSSDGKSSPNESFPGTEEHHVADQSAASAYFKEAQWSADGTTVITNSADHHIRTYILPPDLLDDRPMPHSLSPYNFIASEEPIYSTAIYPFYSLQDASTTIMLSAVRDHPIRLNSVLYPGLLASYSLISPTTEAFITPHSLLYSPSSNGTRFLTGSDSLICLFDISRTGKDGPVSRMPTIPSKRNKVVGGGIGMKGIISTLAEDPVGNGMVAAGTFTRHIGLYAAHGSGDTISTFSVAGTEAERRIGGKGITQVLWSPCGRYLYVAERKSDGMLVYDIRVSGRLVSWLKGRKAMTNQRLKFDIVGDNDGGVHEIWAGGTDGYIRMWANAPDCEGEISPNWEAKIHNDSIASAVFHPTASVLATCSGQKHYLDYDEDSPDEKPRVDRPAPSTTPSDKMDNSLRIWDIHSG